MGDGGAERSALAKRASASLPQGDANKEIAVKLGCSEVSVERHVTSLMRKARCDRRARLIVRFWTLSAV
ncbi:MAG TPA: LuxR C-terminal-related transcriptional regulator [Polyangiaceae bacterium]|jgi:DNA-binding CsgD family transcriptional regulator|nr:LuxR C-terminal-related transcriptional regulator [Polyangiaceae bacterium]